MCIYAAALGLEPSVRDRFGARDRERECYMDGERERENERERRKKRETTESSTSFELIFGMWVLAISME